MGARMSRGRMIGVAMMMVLTASVSSALAQTGTIRSCVTTKTGAIRIVSATDTCKQGESLLPWNQQGPTGPEGPQGPAGAAGATGPQGPAGLAGATGAQGPQGPVGAMGATGPQGPQGVQGPSGSTGPQGPQGPAGAVGATFRGEWIAPQSYVQNDVVAHGGQTWIAVNGSQGLSPDDGNINYWVLLASKGADGAPGETGSQGPQGPSGPAGATGATGPQGSVGPQGVPGPQGPQGLVGATGATGAQGVAGPTGPVGATGPAGPQGPRGPSDVYSATYSWGQWTLICPAPGTNCLRASLTSVSLPVGQYAIFATLNVMFDGDGWGYAYCQLSDQFTNYGQGAVSVPAASASGDRVVQLTFHGTANVSAPKVIDVACYSPGGPSTSIANVWMSAIQVGVIH
jgi:hypothetical protein